MKASASSEKSADAEEPRCFRGGDRRRGSPNRNPGGGEALPGRGASLRGARRSWPPPREGAKGGSGRSWLWPCERTANKLRLVLPAHLSR